MPYYLSDRSWHAPRLSATGCHVPYGFTQCYLSPDGRHKWTYPALTPARHVVLESIYLHRRDGRLSWPRSDEYVVCLRVV